MKLRALHRCAVLFIPLFLLSANLTTTQAQDEQPEPPQSSFPQSDIFLFDLEIGETATNVTNGKNITGQPGYENQPYFVADSSSFLFVKENQSQTDVYEYFIKSGETKQVTDSKGMEFSPQPSPDNRTISFVTDGEGANQSVWTIERSNPDQPSWLLENQPEREPVGYYSWNHETGHILFWSRYGFCTRLVHESKKLSHYVSGNAVPTSPQLIPKTNRFSFLHRQGNGEVWIKELDPESLSIRPVTTVVGNNSHYGWAPDGSIFMMEGSVLHRWSSTSTDGWTKVVDLKDHGVASATRLAISPDGTKLALVGLPGKSKNN